MEKSSGISKKIIASLWNELTVTTDKNGYLNLFKDTKVKDKTKTIYIEENDNFAYDFYKKESQETELNFHVEKMPINPTASFVASVKNKPGIVGSVLVNNDKGVSGTPYISLGGPYTELDVPASYFHILALVEEGNFTLAKQILSNISYMIGHVHSLKATNRSYHQHIPALPLYTSMVRAIAERMESEEERRNFLKVHIQRSILEYDRRWQTIECLCETSHLNTYPNIDSADKQSLSFSLQLPHVIEVRLNMMLYKTEMDIAHFIEAHTEKGLVTVEDVEHTPEKWRAKARQRKEEMDRYLWNDEKQSYCDYDEYKNEYLNPGRADNIYALWAKAVDENRADVIVKKLEKEHLSKNGLHYDLNSFIVKAPEQIIYLLGLKNFAYRSLLEKESEKWNKMIETAFHKSEIIAFSYNIETGTPISDGKDKVFGWTLASYIMANSLK